MWHNWLRALATCTVVILAVITAGARERLHFKAATGLPQVSKSERSELVAFGDPNASHDLVISLAQASAPATTHGGSAIGNSYHPYEHLALADPSNYGERYTVDANGRPVNNDLIVVIHETVGSADSAINTFQTYHALDSDQGSYHTLIDRDGGVFYIVPPERRAFGAGNSVFDGPNGPETVRTNPSLDPSVNNFAYHVSLESPDDGRDNRPSHSGYTEAQYQSLAWLIARSTIPDVRITTHRLVDRSGTRQDPRSFSFDYFFELLHSYPSRQGL